MIQSTTSSNNASSSNASVLFVGTSDGIYVEIPTKLARVSPYLKKWINTSAPGNYWNMNGQLSSSSLRSFAQHLEKLSHTPQSIDCQHEDIQTNLEVAFLADFFEVNTLSQNELYAIAQKCSSETVLKNFQKNPNSLSIFAHMPQKLVMKTAQLLEKSISVNGYSTHNCRRHNFQDFLSQIIFILLLEHLHKSNQPLDLRKKDARHLLKIFKTFSSQDQDWLLKTFGITKPDNGSCSIT